MELALLAVVLVASVIVVTHVAGRLGLSAPLVLTGVGAAVSFVPFVPEVEVEPETVLLGFLPPLLYAAALKTSLFDLRRDKRQIVSLSVGLVAFTAIAVGLVTWWLIPALSLAGAVALGAVVAPPDAVAATAVARRIGLPRRVVRVLEGESLFNDATALVLLSTALVAVSGDVSPLHVGVDFVRVALGGAVIGYVAAKVVTLARKIVDDSVMSVALSFVAPWLAYIPAEKIHASGVIATVVCGVLLAHRAPIDQNATDRVSERLNWGTIQFILEHLVFLLIGLQTARIVDGVLASPLGLGRTSLIALVVLAAVMLLRPLWVLGLGVTRRRWGNDEDRMRLRELAVVSWAGMRGVVTLAAALLLPRDLPSSPNLVFVALAVTIGTLVIQGFTVGWVARRLRIPGPDPREDALQTAQLVQAAASAGEQRLESQLRESPTPVPAQVTDSLRATNDRRSHLAWERLGSDLETESPTAAYRRLRLEMIQAGREEILAVRGTGRIDSDIVQQALASLDVEDSMLTQIDERDSAWREQLLVTPESRRGQCEHLLEAPTCVEPDRPEGCVECERAGEHPVHLRLCLTCGHVACCDSSPGRHATAHYEATGHPVMRSFEPGEAWRWCYVDGQLG